MKKEIAQEIIDLYVQSSKIENRKMQIRKMFPDLTVDEITTKAMKVVMEMEECPICEEHLCGDCEEKHDCGKRELA